MPVKVMDSLNFVGLRGTLSQMSCIVKPQDESRAICCAFLHMLSVWKNGLWSSFAYLGLIIIVVLS